DLRAVRAIARDGYGWTEFVAHTPCENADGIALYFRRAGAWLALFHCFAATDMHQENVIAAGGHPVPIDLETILQTPPAAPDAEDNTGGAAARAAADMIAQSVMAVGILPAYGRAPDTSVFAMGALTADWNAKIHLTWIDVNSDAMRPTRTKVIGKANPNLPHVDGVYGKFAGHIETFIAGFDSYARFLSQYSRGADQGGMFDGFAGIPVRRVVRPTRFYSMLLQRLKTHRSMDDGAVWSAQADFIARLCDWESETDPNWPFLRAERAALLTLNVPHFVVASDGSTVCDADGAVAQRAGSSGLAHARERLKNFDDSEIAWQCAVIRANTVRGNPAQSGQAQPVALREEPALVPAHDLFKAESDRIAAQIAEYAIRRGNSAAWIGLDWMGDAEAFQLAVLGPDLYNGVSGIAVFLAAHAAVASHAPSAELARAAVAQLRGKLKDRNAARFARSLGIGGATGLGSIVYALSVIGASLDDPAIVADAQVAAMLMTDGLIAADKRLDALGGSAGAILGLLRLYRHTGADDVLGRAVACGDHLLRNRIGAEGQRTFVGHGLGPNALNGMSHGAAGFVYALASLAAASGRGDFEQAAAEALAFENASYDANRHNWPDLRHAGEPGWACRWCHGAPGIGLARAALLKRSTIDPVILKTDVAHALSGVEAGWPAEIDTLCCGTLGSVEFVCEAADALERPDLRSEAAGKLAAVVRAAQSAGDYRWNSGERRFNLGLFRGIAGVGYTLLRRCNPALPNVLIWE
ncbi:type 2 lanthipeptide synthetase LanM family protein, partial [Pseudorhodoplanes sp.]|uniref:type 2 lanthipeptide synthetase LanM family protein n=1 Tax=Pseudorhodoplanes sp. TaxID=1934341 RepID=UPI00391D341D